MTTTKMKFLFVFVLLFFSFGIYSQEEEQEKEQETETVVQIKKNALSVSAGTPGLGFGYARRLGSKLNLKVAWHSISLNDQKGELKLKGEDVQYLANLKTSVFDLLFEFLPFRGSSFKITGGAGYLSEVNLNATLTYQRTVKVGQVVVNNKDVGQIIVDTSWKGIAPYVGIGFGRAIPKRRLGLSLEVGTYFATSPDLKLTSTKLLAPTSSQQETLKENISELKYIPKVNLKLSYKF